jgi:hypothetical protein
VTNRPLFDGWLLAPSGTCEGLGQPPSNNPLACRVRGSEVGCWHGKVDRGGMYSTLPRSGALVACPTISLCSASQMQPEDDERMMPTPARALSPQVPVPNLSLILQLNYPCSTGGLVLSHLHSPKNTHPAFTPSLLPTTAAIPIKCSCSGVPKPHDAGSNLSGPLELERQNLG